MLEKELKILNKLREKDLQDHNKREQIKKKGAVLALFIILFCYGLVEYFNYITNMWLVIFSLVVTTFVVSYSPKFYYFYYRFKNRVAHDKLYGNIKGSAVVYLHGHIIPKFLRFSYSQIQKIDPKVIVSNSRFLAYPWLISSLGADRSIKTLYKNGKNTNQNYKGLVEDYWRIVNDHRVSYICEYKLSKLINPTDSKPTYNSYGKWLVVQTMVDHNFTATTIVSSKLMYTPYIKDLENLTLEGLDFNQFFKAYTSNQREARVCLKTNVMEALVKLEKETGRVFVEFKDGFVIIGVESGEEFLELKKDREFTIQDLDSAKDLIDILLNLTNELNINHEYLYKKF